MIAQVAHGDVEMPQADAEGIAECPLDGQLLDYDFAAFFDFLLELAEFLKLQFQRGTSTAVLKFHLGCQLRIFEQPDFQFEREAGDVDDGAAVRGGTIGTAFLVGPKIEVGIEQFAVAF